MPELVGSGLEDELSGHRGGGLVAQTLDQILGRIADIWM